MALPQTIYYKKEYNNFIKEQTIIVLLLWGVALAGAILAKFNQSHFLIVYIMLFTSLFPLLELLMYYNAIYLIEVNEDACIFISRKRSLTIPITDIESLIKLPHNVMSFRLKNTNGFLLINGYLLADDAHLNKKFYITWNRIFFVKLKENDMLLEPFIQYVGKRNRKFHVKSMTESEYLLQLKVK